MTALARFPASGDESFVSGTICPAVLTCRGSGSKLQRNPLSQCLPPPLVFAIQNDSAGIGESLLRSPEIIYVYYSVIRVYITYMYVYILTYGIYIYTYTHIYIYTVIYTIIYI